MWKKKSKKLPTYNLELYKLDGIESNYFFPLTLALSTTGIVIWFRHCKFTVYKVTLVSSTYVLTTLVTQSIIKLDKGNYINKQRVAMMFTHHTTLHSHYITLRSYTYNHTSRITSKHSLTRAATKKAKPSS